MIGQLKLKNNHIVDDRSRDIQNSHQEHFVEFECGWILSKDLIDTIEPLKEHWTALVGITRSEPVPAAIGKLMPVAEPFTLHQRLKTLDRSVVGIEHEFSESGDLRCTIPTVRAMDENGPSLFINRGHDE